MPSNWYRLMDGDVVKVSLDSWYGADAIWGGTAAGILVYWRYYRLTGQYYCHGWYNGTMGGMKVVLLVASLAGMLVMQSYLWNAFSGRYIGILIPAGILVLWMI